jgi:hypothetical protein
VNPDWSEDVAQFEVGEYITDTQHKKCLYLVLEVGKSPNGMGWYRCFNLKTYTDKHGRLWRAGMPIGNLCLHIDQRFELFQ